MAQSQHTLHVERMCSWALTALKGINTNEMVNDEKLSKGIACIPCSLVKDVFLTDFTSHMQDLFLSDNP